MLWTHWSVQSQPVIQECPQAQRYEKLIQAVLDDGILPIRFPMEIPFKAQKAMLVDWAGDVEHPEWRKLNEAIDARIKYHRPPQYGNLQMLLDRAQDRGRWHKERRKAERRRRAQSVDIHRRLHGRPNVATGLIDPIEMEAADERVGVPVGQLTLALVDACYVDDVRQVTNNSFRDEDGRRVWTISFTGGSQLVLMYSKDGAQLIDWDYDGVRFERLGDQLFVLPALSG